MKQKLKEINLSFVGDILPSNMTYTLGFGNYEKINNTTVIDVSNKPDVFFANLEAPLMINNGSMIPFAGNPKIIELLKEVGINVVSISNNHILELGEKGFYDSIRLLRDNNIKVIGINENNSSNIEIFEIGDQVIAFAAFNAIHDIQNPSLYANLNESGVDISLIKMQNLNATFKVVSVHWGNEYINYPNPDQIKMARYIIDKGFDLIIGHHPHVVQKIEIIKSHHVFYSLGNAYFDYLFTPKVKKGLRVNCTLSSNGIRTDFHFITTEQFGFKKIEGNCDSLILSENEIKKINSVDYNTWFSRKIKRIRTINRLKMKLFLIKLFISLPGSGKLLLLNNIKYYIISKFQINGKT